MPFFIIIITNHISTLLLPQNYHLKLHKKIVALLKIIKS